MRITAPGADDDGDEIARHLGAKRFVTPEHLAHAREVREHTGRSLSRILIDLGYATEQDIVEAHALLSHIPFIDLDKFPPEPVALCLVPESIIRQYNVLPVKKDGQKLWVAVLDHKNVEGLDTVHMVSRCPIVTPMLAAPDQFAEAVTRAFSRG